MDFEDAYMEISGTVQSVIYQNEENGYTVLRLLPDGEEAITVVGCLPFAAPGERLNIHGSWTKHQSHGEQFKAEWADRLLPEGKDDIYSYLASGIISGVGPKSAMLIVSRFGEESLRIIEEEPQRLEEIKGISKNRAQRIGRGFVRHMGIRRLLDFFARHGLSPGIAMRLYSFYGDKALEILSGNPYIMAADHIGAAFSDADAVALSMGFEGDSPERVSGAILFEMRHNSTIGHCFLPREKLIMATSGLIGVPQDTVSECLDYLVDAGEVICEQVSNVQGCYLSRLYDAEVYVTEQVHIMSKGESRCRVDVEELIAEVEAEQGIEYAPMQRKTLHIAAKRNIMIITGGPGTGKTTCVRAILALYDKLGLECVLAAPTGRAAKRLGELSGRDASTIHRLLEAGYTDEGRELSFRRGADDPLQCDALILDECSMVDIILMEAVLKALPEGCRLVLVGDADQLPSVGPGNVFNDIIRSRSVEAVRLTEIFRQTQESDIVSNAHRINHGELPDLRKNKGDFFFMRRLEEDRLCETVVDLCRDRLPNNMGIDPMDIQVLSPTRRRGTGTAGLNRMLQAALNPPDAGKKERTFGEIILREGDRVMQIRNNYDIIWTRHGGVDTGSGIFNGDIGQITRVDLSEGIVEVDFDGRITEYTPEMLSELEHAYAMTVHKSQGSEYRAVVLVLHSGSPMLFTRGVLYTAVTRARELLIIVGDDQIAGAMVHNDRQQRRYSGLRWRLARKFGM